MAGSQWSYRRNVQQDALGKVNRVKEIRRRGKNGLKINRQQPLVRKKVSRAVSVRWREVWEGGEGVVMERVVGEWEAVVLPTTSQILGPPWKGFCLPQLLVYPLKSNWAQACEHRSCSCVAVGEGKTLHRLLTCNNEITVGWYNVLLSIFSVTLKHSIAHVWLIKTDLMNNTCDQTINKRIV